MNIIINKSNITNYGNQIIDYSNEFKLEIKKFSALIESINTVWDGADALKYINTMKEKYITGLEEIKSILDEYGNYLKKVPETYSTVDEVFSSKNIDI